MKKIPLIASFLTSFALVSSAFAVDAATAFSVSGNVRVKNGEDYSKLASGMAVVSDSTITVSHSSSLGLKAVDGSTIFFGPDSSFKISYVPDSGSGSVVITLLRGLVSGAYIPTTGGAPTVTIRTAVGTVLTNGSTCAVSFAPSVGGSGSLRVSATLGDPIVRLLAGSPFTVRQGNYYQTGTGINAMSPSDLRTVSNSATGKFNITQANPAQGPDPVTPGQANVANPTLNPDLGIVRPPVVISPVGEAVSETPAPSIPAPFVPPIVPPVVPPVGPGEMPGMVM